MLWSLVPQHYWQKDIELKFISADVHPAASGPWVAVNVSWGSRRRPGRVASVDTGRTALQVVVISRWISEEGIQ